MARSFEQLLLYHWLPKLYKTQTLMHEDIAWGHMNLPRDERTINCVCCGGVKYRQCDVRWPCLVVDGIPNVHKKRYGLVDGNHRMSKMKEMKIKSSEFYVFQFEEWRDNLNKLDVALEKYAMAKNKVLTKIIEKKGLL